MADSLRAGDHNSSIDDDSMTAFIEASMRQQWFDAHGEELPQQGAKDRRILFAAVARGVLRYLYEHRDDLVTTLMHPEGIAGEHRHDADFDVLEKLP